MVTVSVTSIGVEVRGGVVGACGRSGRCRKSIVSGAKLTPVLKYCDRLNKLSSGSVKLRRAMLVLSPW